MDEQKSNLNEEVKIGANSLIQTMSERTALELAGAVWCSPKNRHKVMDVDLATEFARVLQQEVNRRLLRNKINFMKALSAVHGPLSTKGVEAAKEIEAFTGKSPYQWEQKSVFKGKMQEASKPVKGKSIRFTPEQITEIEIGEDRDSFYPLKEE